jgi:hypothetical protein
MYRITIVCLIFLSSCRTDCLRIDCSENDRFYFTIKSSITGEDLLFGPSATLSTADVSAFYISNTDTLTIPVFFNESYASLNTGNQITTFYLEALGVLDTIETDIINHPKSNCCPASTQLIGIKVNGVDYSQNLYTITSLVR